MAAIEGIFVRTIEVTDPIDGTVQELEIWKDPESGGMFALDSGFLDFGDNDELQSPYNPATTLRLPVERMWD